MTTLSDALAEAYASEPDDVFTLDTIELHHPAFLDELGLPSSIRVVNNTTGNIEARLENTAPLNPGEVVLFRAVPFSFKKPEIGEDSVPAITLAIPIVNRDITRYLEQAISLQDPIKVYYRPYLNTDLLGGPQADPPVVMEMKSAKISNGTLTGTASLDEVHNWPFPGKKYTRDRFPSL